MSEDNLTTIKTSNSNTNNFFFFRIREYNENDNEGAFEIIPCSTNNTKLNPFKIGKLLNNNHQNIDNFSRRGKSIAVKRR